MAPAPRTVREGRPRPGGAAGVTFTVAPRRSGGDLMGSVIGLTLGIGLLLVWQSRSRRPVVTRREGTSRADRLAQLLAQAGYPTIRPHQLLGICAGVGVIAAAVTLVVTGSST